MVALYAPYPKLPRRIGSPLLSEQQFGTGRSRADVGLVVTAIVCLLRPIVSSFTAAPREDCFGLVSQPQRMVSAMRRERFARELRVRAAALRKIALEQDPEDGSSISEHLTRVAEDLEQRASRFETAGV